MSRPPFGLLSSSNPHSSRVSWCTAGERKKAQSALCPEIPYYHEASSKANPWRTLPQMTSGLQTQHDAAPFSSPGQYMGRQRWSHARQRICGQGFHVPHRCQPFFQRNVGARQKEDSGVISFPLQECCETCRIVSVARKGACRHVARPHPVAFVRLSRRFALSLLCSLRSGKGSWEQR